MDYRYKWTTSISGLQVYVDYKYKWTTGICGLHVYVKTGPCIQVCEL